MGAVSASSPASRSSPNVSAGKAARSSRSKARARMRSASSEITARRRPCAVISWPTTSELLGVLLIVGAQLIVGAEERVTAHVRAVAAGRRLAAQRLGEAADHVRRGAAADPEVVDPQVIGLAAELRDLIA